jgi:hypothetical protein
VTIVQPLIQPLYDGKSIHEVAQLFFRENYDKRDFDIIRENWQRQGFRRRGASDGDDRQPDANVKSSRAAPADRNAGAKTSGGRRDNERDGTDANRNFEAESNHGDKCRFGAKPGGKSDRRQH